MASAAAAASAAKAAVSAAARATAVEYTESMLILLNDIIFN